jgi:hypothetical protein
MTLDEVKKFIKKLELKNFKSFREICYEKNCSPGVVRNRLLKGYSIDEAFDSKSKKKTALKNEIRQKIKNLNIDPEVTFEAIHQRIKKGFTIEQAIKMPKYYNRSL